MTKARLVITAVVREGRSQGEVAREYGLSQGWISRLVARYRARGRGGVRSAVTPPEDRPRAIPDATAELIVWLRRELAGQGLDADPQTICWHLEQHHRIRVSAAAISRYLARAGLVTPEPRKRPKSSYLRFEAQQPSECWQAGVTHYPFADGTGTEILTWLAGFGGLSRHPVFKKRSNRGQTIKRPSRHPAKQPLTCNVGRDGRI